LRIEVHREIPLDLALGAAWDRLVHRMERPEIFYTYEWARAVSLAYGKSLYPFLVLGYDQTELVGVAAMATDLTGKRASFLGATTSDYCDFISRPEDRYSTLDAALSELRKAAVKDIALANLPEDSATLKSLPQVAKHHQYKFGSRLGYVCAHLGFSDTEQRDQLKRRIKKRKSYRYGMNALARQGSVRVDHLSDWKEVESALPEFFVAHVARFLATSRISNISHLERRTFLAELARLLSESGWLALTRLSVRGRAVAWNYGFRFNGSWFYYQPTFETDVEQYSPGVCLLSEIIVESAARPEIHIVDLGLGAEGYKERFAEGTRKTLYVTLSRSRTQQFRHIARYHAAEAVKKFPRVESSLRNVRAKVSSVRARSETRHSCADDQRRELIDRLTPTQKLALYEYSKNEDPDSASSSSNRIVSLDLRVLAKTVMESGNHSAFQTYLLRLAQHLSVLGREGFARLNDEGDPVEFCCIVPAEQTLISEKRLMRASAEASVICDIFTTEQRPNTGLGESVIRAAVDRIRQQGRKPWAAIATNNVILRQSLELFGFVLRGQMSYRQFFQKSA